MEKEKKNNSSLIVGGLAVLGLSVGGLFLAQSNAETQNTTNVQAQTESVINLPATNEKVNGLSDQLKSAIKDIKDEINRRELEMRAERDLLDREQQRQINRIYNRLERLEELLFELVGSEN